MTHRGSVLAKSIVAIGLIAGVGGDALARERGSSKTRNSAAHKVEPLSKVDCSVQRDGFIWVEALQTCFNPGGYLWAEGYANSYTGYPSDADKVYGIGTLGLTLNASTYLGIGGPLTTNFDVRFQYRSAEP